MPCLAGNWQSYFAWRGAGGAGCRGYSITSRTAFR